jgi:hypothetical protein
LASWQLGHFARAGPVKKSWARRLFFLILECLRFGLGIAVLLVLACSGNVGCQAGRILGALGPEIYKQTEIKKQLTDWQCGTAA